MNAVQIKYLQQSAEYAANLTPATATIPARAATHTRVDRLRTRVAGRMVEREWYETFLWSQANRLTERANNLQSINFPTPE